MVCIVSWVFLISKYLRSVLSLRRGFPRSQLVGSSKGPEIVWLKTEQGKVEVGAYAIRAVVGLRYRHN